MSDFESHLTDRRFCKTKSAPNLGTLSYLLLNLTGHVAQNWNTVYPNLQEMHKKLAELRPIYINDTAASRAAAASMCNSWSETPGILNGGNESSSKLRAE